MDATGSRDQANNAKPKKLLAEQMLGLAAMKELLSERGHETGQKTARGTVFPAIRPLCSARRSHI